jgi:hypothetical protein
MVGIFSSTLQMRTVRPREGKCQVLDHTTRKHRKGLGENPTCQFPLCLPSMFFSMS